MFEIPYKELYLSFNNKMNTFLGFFFIDFTIKKVNYKNYLLLLLD